MEPPKQIAIERDDYSAKHVGKLPDGRQFFLTRPFEVGHGTKPGRDFIALYLFDAEGVFLEAGIDDLGPRERMNEDAAGRLYAQRLRQLEGADFCRIEVEPFVVERFGMSFGLMLHPPEGDEGWYVTAEPGDYMAFYAPWNGDYDT